jgi:hypothetical protein
MSVLQLTILAIGAMGAVAILRLVRVHYGRTAFPEHGRLFVVALVILPPVALAALTDRSAGAIGGLTSVPLFAVLLGGVAIVMGIVGMVARRVAPGRLRPLLSLALTGGDRGEGDARFDPPLTAKLAESVASVDQANGAFPRGLEFPLQVGREGFRAAWDRLSEVLQRLEALIAADQKVGVVVAAKAVTTALDARSRLDSLRRIASDEGQAWAADATITAA